MLQRVMWNGFDGHCQKILYKPNNNSDDVGSFKLYRKKDRYEIWSLSVDIAHRQKGYATQMLTEFLSIFKSKKPLVLYVYKDNEIAIRLYKKVGFVIVNESAKYIYQMQYNAI